MSYKQIKDATTGKVIWVDEETGTPVRDPDVADQQAEEMSHLQEGSLFHDKGKRMGNRLVIGEDEDPYEVAADNAMGKQRAKRAERIGGAVEKALNQPAMAMRNLTEDRVVDPTHEQVRKLSWKEFVDMRLDPQFESFAKYHQKLIYYCGPDGLPDVSKPRIDKDGNPKPIRPFCQNEMGILHRSGGDFWIITLKDAGPDDVGEGKYHQVHKDTPL